MNMQAQILNTIVPLSIIVLAMLPFLFFSSLRQAEENIKPVTYNLMVSYLICLGCAIVGLITVEGIIVMSSPSGARALFICTLLFVACLDKAIDLLPSMIFIKASLIKRLVYFVNILCSVPLIWQILMSTVPDMYADNFKFMGSMQILLMLIMLALGVVNGPLKQRLKQSS